MVTSGQGDWDGGCNWQENQREFYCLHYASYACITCLDKHILNTECGEGALPTLPQASQAMVMSAGQGRSLVWDVSQGPVLMSPTLGV